MFIHGGVKPDVGVSLLRGGGLMDSRVLPGAKNRASGARAEAKDGAGRCPAVLHANRSLSHANRVSGRVFPAHQETVFGRQRRKAPNRLRAVFLPYRDREPAYAPAQNRRYSANNRKSCGFKGYPPRSAIDVRETEKSYLARPVVERALPVGSMSAGCDLAVAAAHVRCTSDSDQTDYVQQSYAASCQDPTQHAEIARRDIYRPGDVGKNQLGNVNP